jgi:ribosomal protein S27AE
VEDELMTVKTKPSKCPKCGLDGVIPIMYGDPAPEAWAAAERGELQLGGCCVEDGMPIWHCTKCGHEFGELEMDDDVERYDLDEIIASIEDDKLNAK